KGKVLPVSVTDKKVDWFYYDVPQDMRATTPEEVGTVVQLFWGEDKVGEYHPGGGGAYVRTCRVVVIDHEKRLAVGEASFRGGDPPRSSRNGVSQHGSYPTESMVSFLKSLPKR